MATNHSVENKVAGKQYPAREPSPENSIQERLLALELQLKIFKQAESIGEIGNWQINLNTFDTWYSDNVFRIYGLEPYTVNSRPDTFHDFLHEDDRAVVLTALERSYAEKVPLHLEFRIRRLDGQERHINVVSSITKNHIGEPLLTGITQDITDRKNLEIQLREYGEKIHLQNELFRHAEQIGLFGTWQVNLSTRQTHYSENYFRIFGLKPTGLSPGLEEFTHFIHPEDQSQFKESIRKIFEEQHPLETDFRILKTDGRPKFARMKSKMLKNADGDLLIVGVIKDITASTKLEKQLREINEQLILQNEAFRQAEKTTHIGSWTWNLENDEVHFSEQVHNIFGLKTSPGKSNFESLDAFVHPIDRPQVQQIISKLRKQPTEIDYRYRIVRPDGKTRYLKTSCVPIVAPDAHTTIIGIIQDVTDEYLLNQQLKERINFAETLSENVVEKICFTNSSNNIIGWSLRSELAFKLKRGEVLGRNIFEVLPKLKNAEMISMFNKVLNGEVVHVSRLKIPYIDEAQELTMVPFKVTDEEVTAVLLLLHDSS